MPLFARPADKLRMSSPLSTTPPSCNKEIYVERSAYTACAGALCQEYTPYVCSHARRLAGEVHADIVGTGRTDDTVLPDRYPLF